MTEGAKQICIKATDTAGNAAAYDSSVVFTKDVTAPSLSLTDNGDISSANEGAYTISGTCVDASSGTESEQVTITVTDIGTLFDSCSSGAFSSTHDLSGVTDGSVSISAIVTDVAGNVSGADVLLVDKDATAPTLPTVVTVSGSGATLDVAFTASTDAAGNLDDYEAIACTSNDCSTSCTSVDTASSSPVAVSLVTPAAYYGCVRSTDSFGNKSSYVASSNTYTYSTPPIVGTPTLLLSDTYYYTTTLTWSAATSADPNLEYDLYYSTNPAMDSVAEIKANGTHFYNGTTVASTAINELQPDTTYYINVIVSDDSGNEVAYTKEKIKTDALDRIDISQNIGCAINADGKAYCWGDGQYCGLGNNDCSTDHETPVAVDTTNFSGKYLQITTNHSLACGLGDDQKIYCWGYGGLSGLGDGSTTNNPIPTEINDTAIGNPSWRYVWSGKIWFVVLMMLSVVLLQMEMPTAGERMVLAI